METEISIGCWIYDTDVDRRFFVKIPGTETVAALKETIKNKNSVTFRDIDAYELDLYTISKSKDIGNELQLWTPENKSRLDPQSKVSRFKKDLIIVDGPKPVQAAVAPTDLALNCWVRGREIDRIFTVKIPRTETVAALKEAIKNMNSVTFRDIDAYELDLYRVCLPYDDRLGETLQKFAFDREACLAPVGVLSNIFRDPPAEHVHVVIEPPQTPSNLLPDASTSQPQADLLAPLIESFARVTTITSRSLTPSQAAKSSEYAKFQTSNRRLLDCRSSAASPTNTVAPPIQLFHPAFAYFSSKAFDPGYNVPDTVLHDVRDLMAGFTLIHPNEEARQRRLRNLLSKVFNRPLDFASNSDKTSPDFVVKSSCGALSTFLIIGEEKNEFGDGGSDPSAQAAFSFMRTVSQDENSILRRKCCCPVFIIAHAGPWLTIMGGVITSHYIVQRLTDFLWVPVHSTHDDVQFHRIARVFYALRESIEKLDLWYKSLEAKPAWNPSVKEPHARFFPFPRTYLEGGNPVEFEYQTPLEEDVSCVTYRARTTGTNPKDIVVKFVTSYGEDAHRMMATAGYAPEILYCGKIDVTDNMPSYGNLRMVVMKYVNGWTLEDALKQNKVPTSFETDIRNAFKHLHDGGYVYGDLRRPNVMITSEGGLKLIDFDWAGKKDEARYPIAISGSIRWPAGVQGLGLIQQEHDLVMLEGLISSQRR
ncbi:hypothetical protein JVU11DRAFT_9130 [Chiua virens]|nr:hypothetical protein JVU11DRAFT_9130 [Chiua virens]